jgi:cytochrome c-type biogenesis protein CcmH/NrfG
MNNRKLALADYEQALKIKPDYDDAAIGKGRILGR